MVLEEPDRLPDDFCIRLIPEIGDGGHPGVLHKHVSEIFRGTFPNKHRQDGDREQCPDTMNLWREEGVQINSLMRQRIPHEKKSRIGSARIQHSVKYGCDHQRDEPFGESNQGKAHNP